MSYDHNRRGTSTRTTTAPRRALVSPTPITSRPYVPAAHSRPQELTPEQQQEIKEAFEIFDADHDGQLDHHELKVAMRALGFDVRRQDVTALIQAHDHRGTRTIHLEDFRAVMTEKMIHRDPMEEIERAFRLFDEEGTGKISVKNLKRVARDLNENIDEGEIVAMIEEFDLDGDGEISMEEFVAIMRDEQ